MIGRTAEKKLINELLQSPRSEFLAVTGRRRVGKTFLIDTLLQNHYCFNLTGIQDGDMRKQLINFAVKLTEYAESPTLNVPTNWQFAFFELKRYLQTLPKDRKQVIFIDELPWVYTPRSGFIQLLAHFWNDYLSKEPHFLLVICGSATSWITKKVINDPGGLHNRITENIHLHPFSIRETNQFLQAKGLHLNTTELTRIYMSLGGIPFYLEKLRKGESFSVAIERLCFSPNGSLRNEYNNLFKALFSNAEIHQKIVATLARFPYGIDRKKLATANPDISTGSLQRCLEELLLSDFVVEITPFNKKKRGSRYRLVDEYSLFYHQFIESVRTYTAGMWQQLAASQSYKIWAGYAFETFCLRHVDVIKEVLGIRAVYTEVSSLFIAGDQQRTGLQIDLILDRKDATINLCEIKFHASEYKIDKREYQKLLRKRADFIQFTKTKKQVFLTFITNHGVYKNAYATELVAAEITLADLVNTAS